MEWLDQGILLGLRRHGEGAAVASLLTAAHGRHAGLIPGGFSRRHRGALQPGNRLQVIWRARLAEHLGNFAWELVEPLGTAWLEDPDRLAALAAACALAEATLPEREPHAEVHAALADLLAMLGQPDWPRRYVKWEIGLLAGLGYGLDLSRCAVTGATEELAFVSPRSGQAVSRAGAGPWRDRLLPLPGFLLGGENGEIGDGLALSGHFLERWVFGPLGHKLPPARTRLVERLRP